MKKVLPRIASAPHFWHSRGYLPHYDEPGRYQSIIFRIHDSVPETIIKRWRMELNFKGCSNPADDPMLVALRERIAHYEDAGYGQCWLGDSRIAGIVENALFHFDGERYKLLSWCVMPNHVHVMIETSKNYSLRDVVHSWKSYTAKLANQLLGRNGEFWAPDYYDRFIRDEEHHWHEIAYIENNPVKAGLVNSSNDWSWSSARFRVNESRIFSSVTIVIPEIESQL